MYTDYDDYLADKEVHITADDAVKTSRYFHAPAHIIELNPIITYMLSNIEINRILYKVVAEAIECGNYDSKRLDQFTKDFYESIQKVLKEE